MALAMGLAAIDTQLHWMVRRVDLKSLTTTLGAVSVPFEELVLMGSASVENRRLGRLDRPATRARNVLNEALLRMTFQSASQVEKALALAGIAKPWSKLAATISPPETVATIRAHLNQLAHRRNLIVHEGDLKRLIRPQSITRESIYPADVANELAWIRRFITAIDSLS